MQINIKATDENGNVLYEGLSSENRNWCNCLLWDDDLEDKLSEAEMAAMNQITIVATRVDPVDGKPITEDNPQTKNFNEVTGEFKADEDEDEDEDEDPSVGDVFHHEDGSTR